MSIVIDLGSGTAKAGPAGGGRPTAVVPSITGVPRAANPMLQQTYVGSQAAQKRAVLRLSSPVVNGQVVDNDGAFRLLDAILLQELRVRPSEHSVLVIDTNLTEQNRRDISGHLADKLGVRCVRFRPSYECVLAHYGQQSGLVVEVGEDVARVVPVCGGAVQRSAIRYCPVAGRAVTEYLRQLLESEGHQLGAHLARELKERLCRLGGERAAQSYELPDGSVLQVRDPVYDAPLLLFEPLRQGLERSVVDAVRESLEAVGPEQADALAGSVYLSGGGCMLAGLAQELQRRLGRCTIRNAGEELRYFAFSPGGAE